MELVVLSTGAKKIGVKWIYKTKLNESLEVDKYDVRLVVKGYAQENVSLSYSSLSHICNMFD